MEKDLQDFKANDARQYLANTARTAMFHDSKKYVLYTVLIVSALTCGIWAIWSSFPALSQLENTKELGVNVFLFSAAVFLAFLFAFLVFRDAVKVRRYISSVEADLNDDDAIELAECLRSFEESPPEWIVYLKAKCADGQIREIPVPYSGHVPENWHDGKAIKVSGYIDKK